MSKLNVSRNVFLEKEELSNMISFFATAPLMKAVLQASYSFGMITNDPSKINPNTVNKPVEDENLIKWKQEQTLALLRYFLGWLLPVPGTL